MNQTLGFNRMLVIRRLTTLALIVLAMVALAAPAAWAKTFIVNTTATPGSGGCTPAQCTLQEAVGEANNNTETDIINFAANVRGDIELSTNSGGGGFSILNTAPDPGVDLAINGPGAGVLAVDGNNVTRAFGIAPGATATISGLTIKRGKAIAGDPHGGGITNSGVLTLTASTVSGNQATEGGGGIYNSNGTLALNNSTVIGNKAGNSGGGLYNNGGMLILTNSTVSGNTVTPGDSGGGIYNNAGPLTLTNSTMSGNKAAVAGGGILGNGQVTLTHSTVSGNSSPTGANLYQIGNSVSMRATILANPLGGSTNCAFALSPTILYQGFNLEFPGTSCGAEVKSNPNLAPLAFNGGPTQTHALQPGSAAIDRVTTDCPPPATDQRFIDRPKDGDKNGSAICDIGAYERNDLISPRVTVTAPTSGKTGVLRNTNLIATFSEKMTPTSINKLTFKLYRCPSTTSTSCTTQISNVTVAPTPGGLKAVLNPFGTTSTLLPGNTKYKAIVSGARDLAGNPLDQNPSVAGNQPMVWFFTTGSS